MGLFSKKKKDNNLVSTQLKFFDGLDLFPKGMLVDLIYNKEEKEVIIQSRFVDKDTGEKKKATLSVDKINKAEYMTEQEIKEKQKSVGGRAVAGGLLLGPLGAVVGGISGVGKKEKKGKINQYIILNYNDGEVITFSLPDLNLNYRKVLKEINNNITKEQQTNIEL